MIQEIDSIEYRKKELTILRSIISSNNRYVHVDDVQPVKDECIIFKLKNGKTKNISKIGSIEEFNRAYKFLQRTIK